MSTIKKNSFSQTLIQSFIDDLFLGKSSYYYSVGKSYPWNSSETPEDTIDTEKYDYQSRIDALYYKKIDGTSISFIVPRINWKSGEIYDIYDDSTSMNDKEFYVMNSNYNVYKCLYNNQGGVSTVEPFGTSNRQITFSDGYVWKYIYTITPSLRNKFLTPINMPVYNSITEKYYNRGSLNSVVITSSGSGYSASDTSIQVSGDGWLEDNPFILSTIVLTNGGSGYSTTPTITENDMYVSTSYSSGLAVIEGQYIKVVDAVNGNRLYKVESSGNLGTVAPSHYYSTVNSGTASLKHVGLIPKYNATVATDKVGSIHIIEHGFGYDYVPSVTITTGSGSGIVMNAVLSQDSIESVVITNGGTGYSNSDTLVFQEPYPSATTFATSTAVTTGSYLRLVDGLETYYFQVISGGTTGVSSPTHRLPSEGIELNGTAVLSVVAKRARGSVVTGVVTAVSVTTNVDHVDITAGGSGYDNTTTITFVGGSPITPAVGVPIVSGGQIVGITVTYPGYGYQSTPTISISGIGSGANLSPVMSHGYGYPSAPLVTFSNPSNVNGTVAAANIIVSKSEAKLVPYIEGGRLRGISIVDGGIGYTTATLSVISESGTGATLIPLFSSGDLSTVQSQSELFSIDGTVSSVVINSQGSGITSISSITVSGDGTGATFSPVLVDGKLTKLLVTNEGSGYTYCNLTINCNLGATVPSVRVILSPRNGHGYNPIRELNSTSFSFNNTFSKEFNNGVQITSSFRQLSIIKNPLKYGATFIYKQKTGSSCYNISTVSSIPSQIVNNSILINRTNNGTFRIIEKSGNQLILSSLDNSSLSIGDILDITINNVLYSVEVDLITSPQIDKFSGDVLYIKNIKPFSPSEDQSVSMNTIFNIV